MEFNHSKDNLCMAREIHYNSLTVSCSPLCLYSKLQSINKPDGFDPDMFSVCTFITTWFCNHDLSSPFTPSGCYHHPPTNCCSTPKCLHWQVNAILSSHPARTTLKQFKRLLFPIPMASQTLWGVSQCSSQQIYTKQLLALSKSQIQDKNTRLLYFWILSKWFSHRKF